MPYLLLAAVGALLLLRFVATSTPRQRLAVLLGWVLPGAGHVYLGLRRRGLVLGGLILLTFLAGMALADFRNVSPFDRHPIWGIAHAFGGVMAGVAALLTKDLLILRDSPYYQVGSLYSGVACLLNVLAMIDAWDLAPTTARRTPAPVDAPPPGAPAGEPT